jgi:hypothetical protein
MTARFDDDGNAIVGNVAIPAALVPEFRALLAQSSPDWTDAEVEAALRAYSQSTPAYGLNTPTRRMRAALSAASTARTTKENGDEA